MSDHGRCLRAKYARTRVHAHTSRLPPPAHHPLGALLERLAIYHPDKSTTHDPPRNSGVLFNPLHGVIEGYMCLFGMLIVMLEAKVRGLVGMAVLLSWWLLSTDAAMHLTHLDVCGNPLGLGKNTRDLSISAMYIQLTGASLL